MSRRLYLLLVTLLASGLIAVGCGDDDDDGGGSDEPAQTQEDTGGAAEDTGGGGDEAVPENLEQAVEDCKQAVASASQLSADTKSDLEELCETAADGDEEAVQEATVEVCRKIIEDTVPAGQAREAGLEACDQAGQTP